MAKSILVIKFQLEISMSLIPMDEVGTFVQFLRHIRNHSTY